MIKLKKPRIIKYKVGDKVYVSTWSYIMSKNKLEPGIIKSINPGKGWYKYVVEYEYDSWENTRIKHEQAFQRKDLTPFKTPLKEVLELMSK